MSTEDNPATGVEQWRECTDVYDVLDQIRRRPDAWLPGRSLRHLQSMLTGYRLALAVHSAREPFALGPEGDFTDWLRERLDTSGSLTWEAQIERRTPAGSTPLDEFFRLLDDFRRDTAGEAGGIPEAGEAAPGRAAAARFPGIEYMSNTFITLFSRRHLLTEALGRLEDLGFRVVRLAAGGWATESDMHRDIAAALRFPDYYGHNLDALNDCLRELACLGPYDDPDDETAAHTGTGLVLAFTEYDRFAAACPEAAQTVLDIVADQARFAAVTGRRFFGLVHSDDPYIRFAPVGATAVMWNREEWLDAGRR